MNSTELSHFLAESYGLQFLQPNSSPALNASGLRYLKTPAGTFSHFAAFSQALTACPDPGFSDQMVFKLVTEGEIHIETRLGELCLPQGSLSLMPWNSQFEEVFSSPASLYVIGCGQTLCQRILPLTRQYGGYTTQLEPNDLLYLTRLIDQYVSQSAAITPMLAGISSQMIIATLGEVLLNSDNITRGKKAPKLHNIIAIKDFIMANLNNPQLSAQTIADHIRLSVNYINRLLAQDGLSLMKLVWQLRLQHAEHLLSRPLTARLQLAEIAAQCGFSSQSHFSQAFRKYYGISPREMRSRKQQQREIPPLVK